MRASAGRRVDVQHQRRLPRWVGVRGILVPLPTRRLSDGGDCSALACAAGWACAQDGGTCALLTAGGSCVDTDGGPACLELESCRDGGCVPLSPIGGACRPRGGLRHRELRLRRVRAAGARPELPPGSGLPEPALRRRGLQHVRAGVWVKVWLKIGPPTGF